jgi:hypothetical protein
MPDRATLIPTTEALPQNASDGKDLWLLNFREKKLGRQKRFLMSVREL